MASLLEKTEELCSTSSPTSVTVRQIAKAAGVNHGLVHHYFKSKRALIAATMAAVEVQQLGAVEKCHDDVNAIETFFDNICDRPTYPALLNWMLVEGLSPEELHIEFPLCEHLTKRISRHRGASDARLATMALLSFVAGWATDQEFTARAAGVTATERSRSQEWGRRQAVLLAFGTSIDDSAIAAT